MPFKFNPFTGTLDEVGSGGSGGSPISNPGVAYVQTNGNNSDAEIGNPAKPFFTLQAAYNAGARSFHLGTELVSTDALIAIDTGALSGNELRLCFSGSGQSASVALLDLRVNTPWTLYLESDKSMKFNAVTLGTADGIVTLFANNCIIENLISVNANEEGGGPQPIEGQMVFCEVGSDTTNSDALAIAYFSMIEGYPRFQPPT